MNHYSRLNVLSPDLDGLPTPRDTLVSHRTVVDAARIPLPSPPNCPPLCIAANVIGQPLGQNVRL